MQHDLAVIVVLAVTFVPAVALIGGILWAPAWLCARRMRSGLPRTSAYRFLAFFGRWSFYLGLLALSVLGVISLPLCGARCLDATLPKILLPGWSLVSVLGVCVSGLARTIVALSPSSNDATAYRADVRILFWGPIFVTGWALLQAFIHFGYFL